MKKICVVFVLFILLSGCSDASGMEQAVALRQRFNQGKTCRFDCTITADYIDYSSIFLLECQIQSDGRVDFTVLSPESISDISGYIDNKGGNLCFDGNVLAFPLLADGLLSPVSMPWIIIQAIKGGYISSCGVENDWIRMTIDDTFAAETLQVDAWIKEDLTIARCEILWKGRRILSMDVESFTWL